MALTNTTAERYTLASIVQNPDAIVLCTALGLEPQHFSEAAHATLYAGMVALLHKRTRPTSTTLEIELGPERFTQAGGASFLMELLTLLCETEEIETYARAVLDAYRVRWEYLHSQTIEQMAISGASADAIRAFDTTARATHTVSSTQKTKHISVATKKVYTRLDEGDDPAISTGWRNLDALIGGWFPGNLITVAGATGMGKTQFAGQAIRNVAQQGKTVQVISIEMTDEELVERDLARESGVDSKAITFNRLDVPQLQRVVDAMGRVNDLPIYICDEGPWTLPAVAGEVRSFHYRYGSDLVVIDYLQLMAGSGKFSAGSRVLELGEITRGLKELAKDLRIPVIMLSQLSREHQKRDNKVPTLADLRDSGSIEQDSNLVLMLYRDDYFRPLVDDGFGHVVPNPKAGIMEVHIAKGRAVARNTVAGLKYDPRTSSLRDLDQVHTPDGY